MRNILVLGGAGFVGSNVALHFIQNGDVVTVLDGMLGQTGASELNIPPGCDFIRKRLEVIDELPGFLETFDIIIDSMAWTSHLDALQNPMYDVKLNLENHIHLLKGIPDSYKGVIVYLASRSQYGRMSENPITENSAMFPDDVQGINKAAADHYFRVYSATKKLNVVTVRFPNCYGPNQKTDGNDIGLIGGFFRELLLGKDVAIYGDNRYRNIVYSQDIARLVYQLTQLPVIGFHDYNVAGIRMVIEDIVNKIIGVIGQGSYTKHAMPASIKAIDIGNIVIDERKLTDKLGSISYCDIDLAFQSTLDYFKKRMYEA